MSKKTPDRRKPAGRKRMTDAIEITRRAFAHDTGFERGVAAERAKMEIGYQIYQARTAQGLSQARLARRIGTTQSVIARLEDVDYDGHSITTLRRVADALGMDVEIRMVPRRGAA